MYITMYLDERAAPTFDSSNLFFLAVFCGEHVRYFATCDCVQIYISGVKMHDLWPSRPFSSRSIGSSLRSALLLTLFLPSADFRPPYVYMETQIYILCGQRKEEPAREADLSLRGVPREKGVPLFFWIGSSREFFSRPDSVPPTCLVSSLPPHRHAASIPKRTTDPTRRKKKGSRPRRRSRARPDLRSNRGGSRIHIRPSRDVVGHRTRSGGDGIAPAKDRHR
mmetsp:Transcript_42785/g.130077  ORF Transcript_42785/g.130077 Transcript_42785/m.130077 type:complete len:223 (+) Transcript_42785:984-1652(+)